MRPHLKYLFIAEFFDGSVYRQTPDDTSRVDPLRSCFYDVLNHPAPVTRFTLRGEDALSASVELTTGLFTVNGVTFRAGDPRCVPSSYRLVFYRQHVVEIIGGDRHDVTYHLGWQGEFAGRNVQCTIAVT
jgi:hypothetical protein